MVALGGDGVGVGLEVVNAACYVLENANSDVEVIKPPFWRQVRGTGDSGVLPW